MSRFLKRRHYRLVLPAIKRLEEDTQEESLIAIIQWYMDKTRVSYTQQDVAEIQSMFLARYGLTRTPNTMAFDLEGNKI